MPQMMPMNWITLFFMFIFIYLLISILMYFSFLYKPKFFLKINKEKSISWKW
uniref:ATP synthase F0 subunit 8 n=1 Tax=Chlorophanus auripes TaxID=2907322 RepID=UPI001F1388F7|nr:ATP synthase F0 subunit 8 [Chlorophanus auripes]UKT60159.1 ATP synthase F0 subunit 8 [Chlorophanus auripes]